MFAVHDGALPAGRDWAAGILAVSSVARTSNARYVQTVRPAHRKLADSNAHILFSRRFWLITRQRRPRTSMFQQAPIVRIPYSDLTGAC